MASELKRITAPGAILILTYRGEDCISEVLDPARRKMIEKEFGNGFFFEEHTSILKF